MSDSRLSNFELLRIIAMFMIAVHHFCVHGIILNGWETNLTTLNHFNNTVLQIFNLGGKIGVNIFLLITGFFLVNGKLKVESFLKIYLLSFIYSSLIMLFYYFHGLHKLPSHFTGYLNPLNLNSYWFISVYLIMYLFLPFINPVLNSISKTKHLMLIFLGIVLWSFMQQQYNQLTWFITVYAIGAYIKRFNPSLLSTKNCFIYGGLSFIILLLWILRTLSHNPIHIKLLEMNNLFILIIAISIFCIFKNLNIRSNKIINYIAVSVFPIYLIHDNFAIRDYLWHKFLPTLHYIGSVHFIFYVVWIPFLVFISCLLFDKIFSLAYSPLIKFITKKIMILVIIYLISKLIIINLVLKSLKKMDILNYPRMVMN